MANIKFSQFTQKTTLGTVDFLVGYTGAQNIQIDPVDLLSSYPTGSGGTGRVAFWEPSNNLSSDYLFKWDNSSNRLGLGVETPTATLHAVTADDTIARFESSDNKAAISISDDDTTGYFSAENGRIGFGTGLGASSSNISILTSNSNVGIGTVSPMAKLHVYGTLIATGISQLGSGGSNVYLTSSSAGNVGVGTSSPGEKFEVHGNIKARFAANGAIGQIKLGNLSNIYADNGDLQIRNNVTGLVKVTSVGNVGIGTSSPDKKLDITVSTSDDGVILQTSSGRKSLEMLVDNGTNGQGKINFYTGANLLYGRVMADSEGLNLDTIANRHMRFMQNTTEVMRIDTNQNVGIGTNSPTEKLHVFKDGTAMIKVDSGSSSSPYKAGIEFLRSSVNGGRIYNDGSAVQVKLESDFGYDAANPTRGGFMFKTAPVTSGTLVDVVRINALGKVGIGTTSPSTNLEIGTSGVVDTDFQMQSDQAGKYFKIVSAGNFTELKSVGDQNLFLNSSGSGGYVSFLAGNSERMRINYNGKVGIGTTSPSRLLQVKDTSGIASIAITSSNTGTSQLELGGTSDNDIAGISYNGSTQKLFLKTNNTPQLYVDNSGNVGIGTDSPASKLEVDGGDIEVDDSASGLILRSPDGTRYRVTVDNSGNLVRTSL